MADEGSITFLPGATTNRSPVGGAPICFRLQAPFGGVTIGSQMGESAPPGDDGTVRIVPGATADRSSIGTGRPFTLAAPIGGATIGAPMEAKLLVIT